MTIDKQFPQLLKVFEEKKSFVICIPKTISIDGLSSAISLYMAFSKAGKQVSIVSEAPIKPEAEIIGVEKVSSQLQTQGGDTLQLSFPYTEGAVDKVSYDIEGDRFKLTIQPKQGFNKLDSTQVEFGYTGGLIDAIVTIECARLDSLGVLYQSNLDKFNGVEIINIDRRFNNGQFGTVNIVDKQSSSIAEIIVSIIRYLKIELDKDASTNLFTGIVYATNNFSSYSVNADTLEIASILLRSGAQKKPFIKKQAIPFMDGQRMPQIPQQQSFYQNNINPVDPVGMEPYADDDVFEDEDEDDMFDNDEEMVLPTQPVEPQFPPIKNTQSQPIRQKQQQTVQQPESIPQPVKPVETPADWLKPKIFKGSSSRLI